MSHSIEEEAKSALKAAQEQYEQAVIISKDYPDIRLKQLRWKKVYCGESINPHSLFVDFERSCGCCGDAIIYAMPYREIAGRKVYSDPPQVEIGVLNQYGYGVHPSTNWVERAREMKLDDSIIQRIKKYLDANEPGDWDDDDES